MQDGLAQLGPAVLHVKVKPMQLVMPPSPLVSPEAVVEMAVSAPKRCCTAKGTNLWEVMVENIP